MRLGVIVPLLDRMNARSASKSFYRNRLYKKCKEKRLLLFNIAQICYFVNSNHLPSPLGSLAPGLRLGLRYARGRLRNPQNNQLRDQSYRVLT